MKKALSIVLSVLLTLSVFTTVSAADSDDFPVIFVPGYTSAQLYINRGTDNEKRIWKIDVADEIIAALKKEIPAVLSGTAGALSGNYDSLFATLKPYAEQITEYLRINDDGSSVYDVEVYPHSVETTRLDKLKESGYYPDYDTLKLLNRYADDTDIYCCTLDWRLGQIDNAAVLNDYIEDVLSAAGAQKVRLIGVSYGGQVAASYLSIYGGDKVDRAVLHCPALDGSSIVPQLFSGEADIAWSDFLRLAQTFSCSETDLSEITDVFSPDFLNGFIKEFISYYLLDLFRNFGSAWDLVPVSDYQGLRSKLLDDGNHGVIMEKTDRYHNEIAAHRTDDLRNLRNEGVAVSIISGYGYRLAVDNGMSSDGVIETASSAGAECAKAGGKLAASYVPCNCGCNSHCHISPDCEVDAASGYLPENTWYVKDMFHGLGTNEKDVSELIADLLFSDNVRDVHSSVKYPQFMASENAFMGVTCRFTNCAQRYLTPYSTELTVTNLSREYDIVIDGITARGSALRFSFPSYVKIAPGESVKVGVAGKLPAEDLAVLSVKIDFVAVKEKYRVAKSRTMNFRFTCGGLYDEVLDSSVSESTPVICEEYLRNEFRFDFLSFMARIMYLLRIFVSRVFNGDFS